MDLTERKLKTKSAKTHKGRLHIQNQLPKLEENPKRCVFLNTENSSEIMRLALSELFLTRKSYSTKLTKKNKLESVFESPSAVEYFAQKNDAALFSYASDSKKRPMNLVVGALFDHKLLDAFEFEVTNLIPQAYFAEARTSELAPNSQPVLLFQGEGFETDRVLERLKRFWLDFYAQDLLEEVNVSDLRRVLVFAQEQDTVKLRSFQCSEPAESLLAQADGLQLTEVGPSFDLKLRRNFLSEDELYRACCKQPKLLSKDTIRNKVNSLLDVQGKVYVSKQNLGVMSLKRYDRILSKENKVNKDVMQLLKRRKEGKDGEIEEDEPMEGDEEDEEIGDEEDEDDFGVDDEEDQQEEDFLKRASKGGKVGIEKGKGKEIGKGLVKGNKGKHQRQAKGGKSELGLGSKGNNGKGAFVKKEYGKGNSPKSFGVGNKRQGESTVNRGDQKKKINNNKQHLKNNFNKHNKSGKRHEEED